MRLIFAAIAVAAALPAAAQRVPPSVFFEGNRALTSSDFEPLVRAAGRSLATEEGLEHLALEVTVLYYEHGFVEVRVEPPQRVSDTAARIRIREGPPYRIGRIEFEGRFRTPTELLRRRIALRTGEPLKRSTIIADLALLKELERRLVVPLTHLDTARHTVDLTFSIE